MTFVPHSSSFAELDSYALTRTAHRVRARMIGDMVRSLFSKAGKSQVAPSHKPKLVELYDFSHSPEAESYMTRANYVTDFILASANMFRRIGANLKARGAQMRLVDELRSFDDRQLADIGLSRADIERAVLGDLRHDTTMIMGAVNENARLAKAAETKDAAGKTSRHAA